MSGRHAVTLSALMIFSAVTGVVVISGSAAAAGGEAISTQEVLESQSESVSDGYTEPDRLLPPRISTAFDENTNQAPTARVSHSLVVNPGEQVRFNAQNSTDEDGQIVDYEWQFGDGTTASGPVTNRTFGSTGLKTVQLTLTDDDGLTTTTEVEVGVLEGAGSAEQPYQVSSLAELDAVRADLDEVYELTADIDAGETSMWNNGKGWEPIGAPTHRANPFSGTFDGQEHTISGLTINRSGTSAVGLFGETAPESTVKDLRLENAVISGKDNVGPVVGVNEGELIAIKASGDVYGQSSVGGVAGQSTGRIENTAANVTVDGEMKLGGIVGKSSGRVERTTARVRINVSVVDFVGGVVGRSFGAVRNSSSFGRIVVHQSSNVGGLVGQQMGNTTIDSFTAIELVLVDSYSAGALIGTNDGSVRDAYWNTERVDDVGAVGGGSNPGENVNGVSTTGMTGDDATAEMSALAFGSIWRTQADDYPALYWETPVETLPPEAEAGPDRTASINQSIRLNASRSTDDRGISQYEWDVDGDDVYEKQGIEVQLSYSSSGTRTVSLRVSDNHGEVDTDTVQVVVTDNRMPSVDAGSNRSVPEGGEAIQLKATATDPDGDELSYSWSLVRGGFDVHFHEAKANYYPPSDIDSQQTAVVQVTVSDGNVSVSDRLSITILPNGKPTAGINGPEQPIKENSSVTLYEAASDPNQDQLTYSWSLESGPGSLSEGDRAVRYTPPKVVNDTTTANVSLTVSDGEYTDTASITIVVEASDRTRIDIYPWPDSEYTYDSFSRLMSDPTEMRIDPAEINYSSREIRWTTGGVATVRERRTAPNATIGFSDEGHASATVSVTYTMPSGKTIKRTTTVTGEVYEFDPKNHDHVDLRYAGEETAAENRESAAYRLHESEVAYDRLQQRLFGLPAEIRVEVVQPDLRDGCLICAVGDEKVYIRQNMSMVRNALIHEFTHIAQSHNDMAHSGDYWVTLLEGHAEVESYEGSIISTYFSEPKPTKADLKTLNYRNEFDEYREGQLLVEAMMIEYGRQTTLDILADSRGESFTDRFHAVTGESFDSFYQDWHPEDPEKGYSDIAVETFPRFVYSQGELVAISPQDTCRVADCERISDYSPKWDVDGDGEFEKTGAVVSWDGPEDGPTRVTLRYNKSGDSLSHTQVIGTGPDRGGFDGVDTGGDSGDSENSGTSGSSGESGVGGGGDGGGGQSGGDERTSVRTIETNDGVTVNVRDVSPSTPFTADLGSLSGESVELGSLTFEFTFDSQDFRVEASSPSSTPEGTGEISDANAIAYFDLDAYRLEEGTLDHAQLTLQVSEDALADGATPRDVVVYHHGDDGWEALETTHLGGDRYAANTTSFSPFAVGVVTDTQTSTSSATPTDSATITAEPTSTATTTEQNEPTLTEGEPKTTSEAPGFGALVAVLSILATAAAVWHRNSV